MSTNELLYVVFSVVCCIGIQGKPSLSFNLNSLTMFPKFRNFRDVRETNLKTYTGSRVRNDSLRMVYFHDQTIAVVELGPKKLLLNCELIETYEPEEALKMVSNLKNVSRPVHITFNEMITLMGQCQQIAVNKMPTATGTGERSTTTGRGLLSNNPLTLLSGIIPGTKWCGTGDIAQNYHDLGTDASVDVCCRTHDLCPVKVHAFSKRYNLTNNSIYTKSHCDCDDGLFDCLNNLNSPSARLMGSVYFDIVQVPCVEDAKNGRKFRQAKRDF